MTPLDWQRIARFVAAQDVRTPLNFIERIRQWKKQIPETLEKIVKEAAEKIARDNPQTVSVPQESVANPLADAFRVHIDRPDEPGLGPTVLRAEVSSGRGLWLASMRHLLTGAANVLTTHRWSVVEPHGGEEWPLTDHPVLRLNFYEPDRYDFGGGWNRPGTELMMPISPRLLLYTQVGHRNEGRFSFSREQTHVVQRLLVERAFRWVFAREPLGWVSAWRSREVNEAAFEMEQIALKRWHQDQAADELEFSRIDASNAPTDRDDGTSA
jgi:hypothetical protein